MSIASLGKALLSCLSLCRLILLRLTDKRLRFSISIRCGTPASVISVNIRFRS